MASAKARLFQRLLMEAGLFAPLGGGLSLPGQSRAEQRQGLAAARGGFEEAVSRVLTARDYFVHEGKLRGIWLARKGHVHAANGKPLGGGSGGGGGFVRCCSHGVEGYDARWLCFEISR